MFQSVSIPDSIPENINCLYILLMYLIYRKFEPSSIPILSNPPSILAHSFHSWKWFNRNRIKRHFFSTIRMWMDFSLALPFFPAITFGNVQHIHQVSLPRKWNVMCDINFISLEITKCVFYALFLQRKRFNYHPQNDLFVISQPTLRLLWMPKRKKNCRHEWYGEFFFHFTLLPLLPVTISPPLNRIYYEFLKTPQAFWI